MVIAQNWKFHSGGPRQILKTWKLLCRLEAETLNKFEGNFLCSFIDKNSDSRFQPSKGKCTAKSSTSLIFWNTTQVLALNMVFRKKEDALPKYLQATCTVTLLLRIAPCWLDAVHWYSPASVLWMFWILRDVSVMFVYSSNGCRFMVQL